MDRLGPGSSGNRTAWTFDGDPCWRSLALVEGALEQGRTVEGFSGLLRWSVGRHAVPPVVCTSVNALIRSGNQCNHALLFHISWVMVKMLCLMGSLHVTSWFVQAWVVQILDPCPGLVGDSAVFGAQPASWCHVGVHNLHRLVGCSPSARRCWRNRHATGCGNGHPRHG